MYLDGCHCALGADFSVGLNRGVNAENGGPGGRAPQARTRIAPVRPAIVAPPPKPRAPIKPAPAKIAPVKAVPVKIAPKIPVPVKPRATAPTIPNLTTAPKAVQSPGVNVLPQPMIALVPVVPAVTPQPVYAEALTVTDASLTPTTVEAAMVSTAEPVSIVPLIQPNETPEPPSGVPWLLIIAAALGIALLA